GERPAPRLFRATGLGLAHDQRAMRSRRGGLAALGAAAAVRPPSSAERRRPGNESPDLTPAGLARHGLRGHGRIRDAAVPLLLAALPRRGAAHWLVVLD